FHDAPANLVRIREETLMAAASVSKGLPEDTAIHILLTNDLLDHEYLGYSPGIPGAPWTTGTPLSGIMAALYEDSDVATDGYTWLHEMGHFVGLQHTSEIDGTTFDPLSDTPECSGARTAACGDQFNLMTTGSWPDSGGLPPVTAGQQLVFRGSPIYDAFGT